MRELVEADGVVLLRGAEEDEGPHGTRRDVPLEHPAPDRRDPGTEADENDTGTITKIGKIR